MSDMKISLVIRAVDSATAPLKAVAGRMAKVGDVAAKVGQSAKMAGTSTTQAWSKATTAAMTFTAQVDRTSSAIQRVARETDGVAQRTRKAVDRSKADWKGLQEGLDKVGNRAVIAGGAVAAGIGLHTAIGEGATAQHRQASLANIADLSPAAQKAMAVAIREEVRLTNQTVLSLTEGMGVLMGAGWDEQKSLIAIRAIGRAATATQATVEDLGKTTLAGVDNLKIPVTQLGKYLDVLAQAGKEGNFELKDMARFLPSLGALAGAKGIVGVRGASQLGAALQVARMGAGNSEEAGTNTLNFLMKLTSPETVQHFAKAGVNLQSEFTKAQSSGDVLLHMGELIQRMTRGNEFKMGELFGDMQVKQFLAPFLQNLGKYKEIQAKSMGAVGVVDRDYARMMGSFVEKAKRFRNGFALAILPRLEPWMDRISGWLDKMDRHPKAFNAIINGVLLLVGGGLLAKGVSGAMGLWSAMAKIASFRHKIGALGSVFAPMKGALAGAVAMGWPFVAILAAVAGLTLLIYKNREPLKHFFRGFGEGFKADVSNVIMPELVRLKTMGGGLWDGLKDSCASIVQPLLELRDLFRGTNREAGGAKQAAGQLTTAFDMGAFAARYLSVSVWAVVKSVQVNVLAVRGLLAILQNMVTVFMESFLGPTRAIVAFKNAYDAARGKGTGHIAALNAAGLAATASAVATTRGVSQKIQDPWLKLGPGVQDLFTPPKFGPTAQAEGDAPPPPGKGLKVLGAAPAGNTLTNLLRQSQGTGGKVEINYNPKLEFRGNVTEQDKAWFLEHLKQQKTEIVHMVDEAQQRRTGWNGAE